MNSQPEKIERVILFLYKRAFDSLDLNKLNFINLNHEQSFPPFTSQSKY